MIMIFQSCVKNKKLLHFFHNNEFTFKYYSYSFFYIKKRTLYNSMQTSTKISCIFYYVWTFFLTSERSAIVIPCEGPFVTPDVSVYACVTQTSRKRIKRVSWSVWNWRIFFPKCLLRRIRLTRKQRAWRPDSTVSTTLCFPFILQVSTSACLDFQVIFCRRKKKSKVKQRKRKGVRVKKHLAGNRTQLNSQSMAWSIVII